MPTFLSRSPVGHGKQEFQNIVGAVQWAAEVEDQCLDGLFRRLLRMVGSVAPNRAAISRSRLGILSVGHRRKATDAFAAPSLPTVHPR